jgi:hypothetical protein
MLLHAAGGAGQLWARARAARARAGQLGRGPGSPGRTGQDGGDDGAQDGQLDDDREEVDALELVHVDQRLQEATQLYTQPFLGNILTGTPTAFL